MTENGIREDSVVIVWWVSLRWTTSTTASRLLVLRAVLGNMTLGLAGEAEAFADDALLLIIATVWSSSSVAHWMWSSTTITVVSEVVTRVVHVSWRSFSHLSSVGFFSSFHPVVVPIISIEIWSVIVLTRRHATFRVHSAAVVEVSSSSISVVVHRGSSV